MERNPIQNATRKAKRIRKIGPDAVCVLCGETRPEVLIRVPWSFLHQNHHVVGEANDAKLTAVLCLNCHAKETELQRLHGVNLYRDRMRTLPEILVSILRAVAAFLHSLADRFEDWAERLAAFIAALDAHFPEWRELPEAKG